MMNWKLVSEKWNQISSQVKAHWDKLTDEDLKEIDGSQESLTAKLQERYGFLRMDAEKKVADWGNELSGKLDSQVQLPATGKVRESGLGALAPKAAPELAPKAAADETPEAPHLDQRMKLADKEEPEEPTSKLNPQVDRSAESRNRPSAVDSSVP
jgi:uncharacterized protein YjbJ (UPF0337 family)